MLQPSSEQFILASIRERGLVSLVDLEWLCKIYQYDIRVCQRIIGWLICEKRILRFKLTARSNCNCGRIVYTLTERQRWARNRR